MTPGWELGAAPALKRERVALPSREGSSPLLPFKVLDSWPLQDQTERERVGLALEPWQSERAVVWPLLFTGLG